MMPATENRTNQRWISNTGRPLAPWPVILLAVLGAAPIPDAETLLREGHTAFARGDYAEAASLYERAGLRATDPGVVAFNLAGAKYHLAIKTEGPSPELQEAEQ